jgi:hypothetical protein
MNDAPQAVMRAARAACAGPDGGTAGGDAPEGAAKTAEPPAARKTRVLILRPSWRSDPLPAAIRSWGHGVLTIPDDPDHVWRPVARDHDLVLIEADSFDA